MFVHIAKKASFTSALQTKYTNSIVFIKDTQEIWTHGTFYAIPDTYKDKIIDLQTAIGALQAIHAFTTISDGVHAAAATSTAKTIKFTGSGVTVVTVSQDGVTIDTPADTLVEGTANGTIKFNGTDVAVKGLGDAAYQTKKSFDDAIAAAKKAGDDAQVAADAAQDTADAKVASVTATANTAITVAGTATAPTVGLKIANTQGNVTLSQTADGLKANTSFPVTGVKADDKVLSMTGTTVGSTLGLTYDSTHKAIKLTGIGGSEIASIDASEFIKDGMVDNVEFTEATKILTITFNTASGKEAIDVDLSALVDAYNGANLKLTAASGFAKDTVLDLAISTLQTDIAKVAAVAGVTKFGGKTGEITVKGGQTANGAVNLEMADNELKASVVGLGSAAYTNSTNYATAAQGGKADTAIQTVREANTGTYISVAAAKSGTTINLTPSVTIQTVATAGSSKGLAEASDVKAYADSLFAWEEL